MRTYYDKDLDYLEIFFQESQNYGEDLNQNEMVFKSEDDDSPVGFSFEKASQTVSQSINISLKQKIGALSVIARKKLGLNQEDAANSLGIPYRTYQRIEEGEIGNVDYLEKLIDHYSNMDFSNLLKKAG